MSDSIQTQPRSDGHDGSAVTLTRPQPYEPLPHTADAAIKTEGSSAAETLGRLVLAFTELVTGGGALPIVGETELSVPGGAALPLIAVDLLRAVHRLLTTEKLIPAAVTVLTMSEAEGARVRLSHGRLDPLLHCEGLEIKGVTYHAARFERRTDGNGYEARIVFDI